MTLIDYASPTAECDLVMKGGITSGIVYPPAVLELAPQYRFRNIGGTSAGAIAAVVTAASEYGRESSRLGAGFAGLRQTQEWLSTNNNLFNLFQPNSETAPLYHTLLGFNEALAKAEMQRKEHARKSVGSKRPPRKLGWMGVGLVIVPGVLFRTQPLPFLGGALIGAIVCGALALAAALGVHLDRILYGAAIALAVLLAAIAGALLGGYIACLLRLLKVAREKLPRNRFGICSGRATGDPVGAPALTEWLYEQTQTLAGRDDREPPLTVGDLACKRGLQGEDQGIILRMITTNLSHAQPYTLPFEDDLFLFREEDLAAFFPDVVLKHLVARARHLARVDLGALRGFHALPWGRDLPVVMLARMSLSFPLLLSALPLYCIRRDAFERRSVVRRDESGRERKVAVLVDAETDLHRVWFSDGGLASNFPIHFFDSWLPSRPTFGINLTSFPEEAFEAGPEADPALDPGSRARLKSGMLASVRSQSEGLAERGVEEPSLSADSTTPEQAEINDESLESLIDAVQLPPANRPLHPPQVEVTGLGSFFNAIWTTAQNYRDSTQARLPSYRERIAQIAFAPDEGGLNLAMGRQQIESILLKGQRAGQLLRDFHFDEHRWVRFRVLMAELEQQLDGLGRVVRDPDHFDALLLERVRRGYPYPRDPDWCYEAHAWLNELRSLSITLAERRRVWKAAHPAERSPYFFGERVPQPEPSLRMTPRV